MNGDTGILKDAYPDAAQEALKRRLKKNKAKMIGLDQDDLDDDEEKQESKGGL